MFLRSMAVALHHSRVLVAEIERPDQLAAGQHFPGLAVEAIHALHHPARVEVAPQAVEACEEPRSLAQPLEGDALEDHVRPGLAARPERSAGDAQEARIPG